MLPSVTISAVFLQIPTLDTHRLCLLFQLSLLYPVYDRFRRIGGVKWRLLSFLGSVVSAFICLAVLWGRLPVLNLLADYAVPLLISIATVLEILAFVFIYGA